VQLVALVEAVDHVCCRYRLRAFGPYLEQAGHTLHLEPLRSTWWGRLRQFRALAGATVVLQRRLLPWWQLLVLRRSVHRLLFDFDDAVFLRDSYSPRGQHHAGRLRRFAALVRCADAVVAGNAFLAAEAQRHAGDRPVVVIPTCVDEQRYDPGSGRPPDGALELVWVGSSSTLRGLERIRPVLEELGSKVPGLRLKLLCDSFLTFTHLPVLARPWQEATEGQELATADVGISWVPDDRWSQGKCGLKVLQYMAASLPVIANPVGVHRVMVQPGQTGFLAQTSDDWLAALTCLASDREHGRQLGAAGRRLLEAEYSVAVGAARWLELLERLEGRQVRRTPPRVDSPGVHTPGY
jgi:glycosyltransferase involved in cell wall biosynthesis